MSPDELVSKIITIDGVYAVLHSCRHGEHITARVPEGWSLEIAQTLAKRGIQALDTARKRIPDCFEVRIDSDYVTVLIHKVERGFIYTLLNLPGQVHDVALQLQDIARSYIPDPAPTEEYPEYMSTEVGPDASPTGPVTPIPKVTAPVSVHTRSARYINEKPIGEGGTAVVCKAYDIRLNREVALKRFKPHAVNSKGEEEDYLAEMESASRIRHHNVLSTFDADIDIQGRYIVMQLIDGLDLQKRTEQQLMGDEFRDFALQAIDGLGATHQAGLVHLDLKPSNIMVTESDSGRIHTTIIDYGKARRLPSEADPTPPKGLGLVGSIYFSSPEYICEQEVDERSDLYSLGCVFYYALTGKYPFNGDNTIQIMTSHMQGSVIDIRERLPSIDDETADAIMSLLKQEKSHRPRSTSEASALFRQIPAAARKIEKKPSNITQIDRFGTGG